MFHQEAKTMFGSLASEIEDRKCDPANSWIRGAHKCTLYLVSNTLLVYKEQCKKCKIFSSPPGIQRGIVIECQRSTMRPHSDNTSPIS